MHCCVNGLQNPQTNALFCFFHWHLHIRCDKSGTLEQNFSGSWTFRLCQSLDLCKNYYSHLNFAVVTFLTKLQNYCYETNKKTCQNTIVKKNWMGKATTIQKILMGKTTTIQKIWMGKTTTIQEFLLPYKKWEVVECLQVKKKKQNFLLTFFISTILSFGQECSLSC